MDYVAKIQDVTNTNTKFLIKFNELYDKYLDNALPYNYLKQMRIDLQDL